MISKRRPPIALPLSPCLSKLPGEIPCLSKSPSLGHRVLKRWGFNSIKTLPASILIRLCPDLAIHYLFGTMSHYTSSSSSVSTVQGSSHEGGLPPITFRKMGNLLETTSVR